MVLRIGLLVLGVLLFLFIGYGAIANWITVFTFGADYLVPTGGLGSRTSDTPAIITALFSTFFSLVGAFAAIVAIVDIRKRRRRRASGQD